MVFCKQIACFSLLFLFLSSCNKEEPEAKELKPFKNITSNGGIQISFIPGPENKVISTTLNELAYNSDGNTLSINASMGSITIAVKDLETVDINASHISGTGPFLFTNLNLKVHAGSVDLSDFHVAQKLNADFINSGQYNLSGTVNYLDLYIANNAYFHGYNFTSDSISFFGQNAVDCEVFVTQTLRAALMSTGNLYYKGNPVLVDTSSLGQGSSIPQ